MTPSTQPISLDTTSLQPTPPVVPGLLLRFSRRRKFPKEMKLEIVAESAKRGVAPTARKYSIATTQIYQWKKVFSGAIQTPTPPVVETPVPLTPQSACSAILDNLNKLNQIQNQVLEKFKYELSTMSANQATNGLSQLAASMTKIDMLKLTVFDRLANMPDQEQSYDATTPEAVADREISRECENLLISLVKAKLAFEKDQRELARSATLRSNDVSAQ